MPNNISFCIEKVRKHDYYRYLCCLLAGEEIRNRLFVIYAFNNEIAKIPHVITEPMAGYIRLEWWREAIDELYNGPPVRHNHEVTKAIYGIISEVKIPKEMFIKVIDGREAEIEFETPENMDGLKKYSADISSSLFELLLRLVEIKDSNAVEAAHYAGIAYGLTKVMLSMKYNAYHNRIMLPKDLMKRCGLTSRDIRDGHNLEAASPIAREICENAEVALNHVRALLKESPKKAFPVFLPLSTTATFLKRVKRDDYDLFGSNLERGRTSLQLQILKCYLLGGIF